MSPDRPTLHVGDPVDATWSTLPNGTRRVGNAIGSMHDDPAAVVIRLNPVDGSPADRLARIRERFPDTRILAYSVDDSPDAAIDASRFGIEYVSGRRLDADGETLTDRIEDGIATPSTRDESAFLEQFVRIVSDRTTDLEGKLDALLDLGRDRLGLSIGYASHTADDRFTIRRHRGGSELLDSLIENGIVDADGSIALKKTYCRRTVGAGEGAAGETAEVGGDVDTDSVGDVDTDSVDDVDDRFENDVDGSGGDGSVVAFTDPAEAGWEGDPAHELFGFGSYIGGRVVVDGEVFGSLCFVDEDEREEPFTDSERLFVELLADWLGRAFERRGAREQREEAVDRMEDTLERIDDAFFALDAEWRFTYVNAKAATLLDRPADELIGTSVWTEFSDAIGEAYETNYRQAMETQETASFVDHYEPLDLWTDVTAYPSPDGLSVFFSDVSEQKRREETLERLLRTAERMQRDADATAVADRLIDAADDILGYGISGVRLFDEDDGLLRLVATSDGVGDRFEGREPRYPGEGIVGQLYESGESRVWTDLSDREDDREYHGMRSLIGVPLGDHGVFVVGSVEPDAFDESDVSVVELLAMNATATLDAQRRQDRLQTYENALKNVDDMVCVLGEDGVVTYATKPFMTWLDVDESAFVGESLGGALPDPEAERVAAAVRGLVGTEGEKQRGSGPANPKAKQVRSVDLTVERDGDTSARHGELRLSALSGVATGVVGTLSDTTDLHRTRTKLSRERDRFERLFERLPDPVIEVSLEPDETVITGVNPAFATQFGFDESTVRGRTLDALAIHDDRVSGIDAGDEAAGGANDVGSEASLDERVREEGFVTAEVHRRTVDGPREFLFRGFTYETTDGRRAFGIYTDITDRKRRERYFRVVNRILRHNLRNELNIVFGFASEIAGMTDDAQIADYAERIETTGKRLADLAEGAAEIKRVVEDGIVSDPEPVVVGPVIDAVRERHAERYPEARIETSVPRGVAIRGDDRFEDAIDHLVENAAVHSRSDLPRIEIDVEYDPRNGTVIVAVADDGPGIPDPVREVITGEMEVTQLQHNTGIGLWIVAWIVEAYGGEIDFGPGIDGDGTTVTLRIPAEE